MWQFGNQQFGKRHFGDNNLVNKQKWQIGNDNLVTKQKWQFGNDNLVIIFGNASNCQLLDVFIRFILVESEESACFVERIWIGKFS